MERKQLAAMIDHTLLKPDATEAEIIQLCNEAVQYQFATVCVQPCWVKLAAKQLQQESSVGVTTVIGFPLGASSSSTKEFETKQAIADGATEVDMVINIGYLKSRFLSAVKSDIEAVVRAAAKKVVVKVIIETSLLTEAEIVEVCKLAVEAGADYVKTSTGFSGGGATASHIQLMRETVGPHIGVKASGGVRDHQGALNMINAGATRIGASAGIAIVEHSVADGNGSY